MLGNPPEFLLFLLFSIQLLFQTLFTLLNPMALSLYITPNTILLHVANTSISCHQTDKAF